MEQITEKQPQDAEFEETKSSQWNRVFGWLRRNKNPVEETVAPKLTFKQKLAQLTVSQWFYFLAFVALIVTVDEAEKGDAVSTVVVVLAGIGLSRELWHLFNAVWSKTLGKGALLVLYAGTANIAIAISALKINAISGIEPSPFIFTLGFATLLMLPIWLVSATILFMAIALVIGNIWLLCSILLRLIGVKVPVHWEDKSFVIVTMILRIIMIPVLIFGLATFIQPYAEQMDVFDQPIAVFDHSLDEEQLRQLREVDPQEYTRLVAELREQGVLNDAVIGRLEELPITTDGAVVATSSDVAEANTGEGEVLSSAIEEQATEEQGGEGQGTDEGSDEAKEQRSRFLDQTIAHFIFHFETYPHSACKKSLDQRSLVIDENMVFLAERDTSELGYKFSVQECQPRYEKE